ncbi:SPASM domain-containing protein, partial [Patescibacteria group bacterium]|nr:SPASM domain-containing protein [Patescibacteria group bacterium]
AGRAVHNQMMLDSQDSQSYLRALEYLNSSEVLPHVLMDEGMMFHQPAEVLQKLLRGRMCGAANRSMHIDASSKVSPCVFLGPIFSFGKIYQDGTVRDFWRGKVGNKFQATRAIRQPCECDSCNRLCKNECPANRFYFWGNYKRQDPNCLYEVTRANGNQNV